MEETVKFDRERYQKEIAEPDYVEAQAAYLKGDFKTAATLLERTVENGSGMGAMMLGTMCEMGYIDEEARKRARELYEAAARRDCPLGQTCVAEDYRMGYSQPRDEKKAAEIFESCRQGLEEMVEIGDVDAMEILGFWMLHGCCDNPDRKRGKKLMEQAVEGGHAGAASELGKAYIYGWDVEEDEKKGVRILKRFQNRRHRGICSMLGRVFYYGFGGEKIDYKKAIWYLSIAAEYGDPVSQRLMGTIKAGMIGENTFVCFPEAIRWFTLSANQDKNDPMPLVDLARVYITEEFEGENRKQSIEYMEQAEERLDQLEKDGLEEDYGAVNIRREMVSVYNDLLAYMLSAEKEEKVSQRVFDHSCKLLSDGEKDVAYDVGYWYFARGYESPCFVWSAEELVELLIEGTNDYDHKVETLLGRIYSEGLRLPKDRKRAAKWWERAWKKGDLLVGESLADYYQESGQEKKRFGVLQTLCEMQQFPGSRVLYKLAECYEKGIGVAKDSKMAAHLTEAADWSYDHEENLLEEADAYD